MKSFSLALFFFVFAFTSLYAQNSTRVTVTDNEDMQYALKDQLYRFPAFKDGKVYLHNGKYNDAKLNLNILTNQIQFIGDKKDTLTILTPDLLHHVEIDGKTFVYHNEGFLEILENYESMTLAVGRELKIADRQKEGAYGTKSSSASITNVSRGFSDQLRYNPKAHEDLLVNKVESFYLIDDESNIHLVNKKGIRRAFPKHKIELQEYIIQNKINFRKEASVRALVQYALKL